MKNSLMNWIVDKETCRIISWSPHDKKMIPPLGRFARRERFVVSKRIRALVIVLVISVLAHLCIFLSGDRPEPCLPRVIIKREYIKPEETLKPRELNPPRLLPTPAPRKIENEVQKCADQNASSPVNASRGGGNLYREIKPTKFIKGQKKKLFILGYQRVGSSFFGQLFDENPYFFYIYEPLDAIYTEMYGTRGGLNVPSDITYFQNGTIRRLSEEENKKAVQLLSDILDCNTDKLPRAFMMHRFWDYLVESYMPSWLPYRSCLEQEKTLTAREDCRNLHLGHCPNRLGMNTTDQILCRRSFYDLEKYGRHNGPKIQPYIKYEDCVIAAYEKSKKCLDIYRQKCSKAHLWATKTVRGSMEQAEKLMATNPNMRLIHLIRDPRPVVTSRSMDNSYRGLYSGVSTIVGGDKAKEAVVYCGTAVRDLNYRRSILEKRFPGRIIEVIYEDFVQNPGEYAKAIYAFLDEKLPDELLPWIKSQTEGNKWKNNANVRMNSWKSRMTFQEGEKVQQNCKQFYDLVPYNWPY